MRRSTLTRGYNVSIVMGMEITNEIYDVRRRDPRRYGNRTRAYGALR
jgi:hypothetical protein